MTLGCRLTPSSSTWAALASAESSAKVTATRTPAGAAALGNPCRRATEAGLVREVVTTTVGRPVFAVPCNATGNDDHPSWAVAAGTQAARPSRPTAAPIARLQLQTLIVHLVSKPGA